MRFSVSVLLLTVTTAFLLSGGVRGLDNGLALTPPMGFLTWLRYACSTDCVNFPDACISDRLVRETAEAMYKRGFVKAGYKYLIIDDCWPEKERDPHTLELIPDKKRFPKGMRELGDFVRSRGMELGIYLDFGTLTCGGYPGSLMYMEKDIQTLQSWGTRYIKMDGCYASNNLFEPGYEAFSRMLGLANSSTVFSCSYPAYLDWEKDPKVFSWDRLRQNCNLWRMFTDVTSSWSSIKSIINLYKRQGPLMQKFAKPGSWNDPDMLVIGNDGMSPGQERVQFGLWAILAAPLMISTDVNALTDSQVQLLQNQMIIQINQDPLGIQGGMVIQDGILSVWTRKLSNDKWAVAYLNEDELGPGAFYGKTPWQMGLPSKKKLKKRLSLQQAAEGYTFTDVFTGQSIGTFRDDQPVNVHVPNTGIRMFLCE